MNGCVATWLAAGIIVSSTVAASSARPITLEERITAQHAIEQVYWNHRIWPKENPGPKPALSTVLSDAAIRARVENYLRESDALDRIWRRPVGASELQAELDRMTRDSRDPELLRELFEALGNDPALIAETLGRQTLVDRLVRNRYAADGRFHADAKQRGFEDWWDDAGRTMDPAIDAPRGVYSLAAPAAGGCVPDNWSETALDLAPRQNATAVWTGSELIVWGGSGQGAPKFGSGGRYNPSTDSWLRTSRGSNAPAPRSGHTAVWTGTEMIVWGGSDMAGDPFGDGGRYNPSTDSWLPTSISSAGTPQARRSHTAVWTGSEMIVWGGLNYGFRLGTGARYDPSTDEWQPIAEVGAPSGRSFHTAVWSGSEMIVWGGVEVNAPGLNTGGRYNLSTDSWEPTSTGLNAPTGVYGHTAVWTGSRMIVWGGAPLANVVNVGGLYDPVTDTWSPTSTGSGVPSPRIGHTAIWTGSEMIVWGGGTDGSGSLSSGGRYNPLTNSWTATRTQQAPSPRDQHSAVWTGTEMIVWGGSDEQGVFNTGGRYSPSTNSWTATSLPITGEPTPRTLHTAVWTGSEMIIWGGQFEDESTTGSGGRYTPATNSWTPTTNGGSPTGRYYHTAVWTGTEMIVWGGASGGTSSLLNSGGRFNPTDGTWKATAKTGGGVPSPRTLHVVVWSGTEMIVWGGREDTTNTNTGGRYDPVANSWTATPTTGAPAARTEASGVWTGSELIVWGGSGTPLLNSGGRYNPAINAWQPTSLGPNVPVPRYFHSAVWTGAKMIVWGGNSASTSNSYINTGGIYDPISDAWTPTSVSVETPAARSGHTAVWTGTEMIVWGGGNFTAGLLASGGRYNPSNDAWQPTSMGLGVPVKRSSHTAIWTGSEMIVWGGGIGGVREEGINVTGAGSRYCADSCASPGTLYQDLDVDGYGNGGVSQVTCAQPSGWSPLAGDCNEANPSIHPGAFEACNSLDDDCNGLVDEDALGVDSDGDGVRSACDVCATAFDPAQSDFDHDGQGDLCDVNDGLIYLLSTDKIHVAWQGESGPASWNVYEGDLEIVRASGIYTQTPGSNPLANRRCGVTDLSIDDVTSVPSGAVKFALVTGVTGGVEGSLGTDSGNVERPNTNPCP